MQDHGPPALMRQATTKDANMTTVDNETTTTETKRKPTVAYGTFGNYEDALEQKNSLLESDSKRWVRIRRRADNSYQVYAR